MEVKTLNHSDSIAYVDISITYQKVEKTIPAIPWGFDVSRVPIDTLDHVMCTRNIEFPHPFISRQFFFCFDRELAIALGYENTIVFTQEKSCYVLSQLGYDELVEEGKERKIEVEIGIPIFLSLNGYPFDEIVALVQKDKFGWVRPNQQEVIVYDRAIAFQLIQNKGLRVIPKSFTERKQKQKRLVELVSGALQSRNFLIRLGLHSLFL